MVPHSGGNLPTLDYIGIVTRDMARSLAFYRLLGLAIPAGAEEDDHVDITIGPFRLAWDAEAMVKGFDPHWKEPVGQRIGLAFHCADAADVDATYHRAVAAGAKPHTPPWDAFWGQRYARIHDPDGIIVDLYAPNS